MYPFNFGGRMTMLIRSKFLIIMVPAECSTHGFLNIANRSVLSISPRGVVHYMALSLSRIIISLKYFLSPRAVLSCFSTFPRDSAQFLTDLGLLHYVGGGGGRSISFFFLRLFLLSTTTPPPMSLRCKVDSYFWQVTHTL